MASKQETINYLVDEEFEQTIKDADKPVFVDFYADWCGPCKMAAPIIEKLAQKYDDKVSFYKLNVDENQTVPSKYGVMSIPAVFIFEYKDGEIKVVANQIGFAGESAYQEMLDRVIK
jgi:thioredoxin 1